MNAKHTPGPWQVEDGYAIVSTDGDFIASCNESDDNCNADARLIAAAPDLYLFVASKAESGDNEALELLERIHGNAKRD